MKTVYKYTLDRSPGPQQLEMPKGAKILSAQMQLNQLCFWALVEPNADTELRTIFIAGTGLEVADHFLEEFIDTVQDGMFVWHVFCDKQ